MSSYATGSRVRLAACQWRLRPLPDAGALFQEVAQQVRVAAGYGADFLLLPELFGAGLMAAWPGLSEMASIRRLAQETTALRFLCGELAVKHKVNLITGSMPETDTGGRVFNTSFLCHRDGRVESYRKLHLTPNERASWDFTPGETLGLFTTDRGVVAVQICYDVEFPELGRLAAEKGAKILFVPFLTDHRHGFHRVSLCARARAVENECYVVTAGCSGLLHGVPNMDLHHAESAIYTPADHGFPSNSILAHAEPNEETMVIADVDLPLLDALREKGSVTNLKDRRTDFYRLERI